MQNKSQDILYQDETVIVTTLAVVYEGQRIPVKSIKRVSIFPRKPLETVLGLAPITHCDLTIELGMFRSVKIGAPYAPSIYSAARGSIYRKNPDMILIAQKAEWRSSDETMAKLRRDPEVSQRRLDEVEEDMLSYRTLENILAAILKAMSQNG